MGFFVSDAQGIIGGDMKPPPKPLKILLTNSRLEDIRFNLFPRSHSFQNRKKNTKKKRTDKKQRKLLITWKRKWMTTTVRTHSQKHRKQKLKKETEKDLDKSTKKAKSDLLVTTDLYIAKEKVLDGQPVPLR